MKMNRIFIKSLGVGVLALGAVVYFQRRQVVRLGEERDRYVQNSEALLSKMKRMQVDSATMAVDVQTLRLTADEYKRLREEDAGKIKEMGIRLKDLKAAAKHKVEINVPVDLALRDTLVLRDTLRVKAQRVEMSTPYIRLSGLIEDARLKGKIHVPVTLRQAVRVEYKRRWIFWKKVKAVHQVISCDNPYVEIKYSECIVIGG